MPRVSSFYSGVNETTSAISVSADRCAPDSVRLVRVRQKFSCADRRTLATSRSLHSYINNNNMVSSLCFCINPTTKHKAKAKGLSKKHTLAETGLSQQNARLTTNVNCVVKRNSFQIDSTCLITSCHNRNNIN